MATFHIEGISSRDAYVLKVAVRSSLFNFGYNTTTLFAKIILKALAMSKCGGSPRTVTLRCSITTSPRWRLAGVRVGDGGGRPSKGSIAQPCWGVHGYVTIFAPPMSISGVLKISVACSVELPHTR